MFAASYFAKSYYPGTYFPPAVVETVPEEDAGSGGGSLRFYKIDDGPVMVEDMGKHDDQDIIDIITIILQSGALE